MSIVLFALGGVFVEPGADWLAESPLPHCQRAYAGWVNTSDKELNSVHDILYKKNPSLEFVGRGYDKKTKRANGTFYYVVPYVSGYYVYRCWADGSHTEELSFIRDRSTAIKNAMKRCNIPKPYGDMATLESFFVSHNLYPSFIGREYVTNKKGITSPSGYCYFVFFTKNKYWIYRSSVDGTIVKKLRSYSTRDDAIKKADELCDIRRTKKKAKPATKKTAAVKLSKSSLDLNLVNKRSAMLKAEVKGTTKKPKWKSSNTAVVRIEKDDNNKKAKIKVAGRGSAIVTVKAGKAKATCSVTVKDSAVVHVSYGNFKSFKEWCKKVKKTEQDLYTFGQVVSLANGQQYRTDTLITNRKVEGYKTIEDKMVVQGAPYNGKAPTKKVKLSLPARAAYTLHRHSLTLSSDASENYGRLMVSVVEGHIDYQLQCSCGMKATISWDIPEFDKGTTYDASTPYQVTSITRTF